MEDVSLGQQLAGSLGCLGSARLEEQSLVSSKEASSFFSLTQRSMILFFVGRRYRYIS